MQFGIYLGYSAQADGHGYNGVYGAPNPHSYPQLHNHPNRHSSGTTIGIGNQVMVTFLLLIQIMATILTWVLVLY